MTSLQVINPYDESLIEEIERIDEKNSFEILKRSHDLFSNRSNCLPTFKRIDILEKTAALVKHNALFLAKTASQEGGKPLTDSKIEIDRAYNGIKVAISELLHFGGREVPMNLTPSSNNRIAYTMREPKGVVLALCAFNHPVNMIIHQIIPAIAIGAPVIVKPASATPLSCRNLVNILYESGLPEAWCPMILCENSVTEKMVSDERIAFLSFIGSAKVGWHLRSKLAYGASCALEHGGAAPVIIDETADIDDAIPLLVKGGFYHAGQVCVSVQRIFVHHSISDYFAERMAKMVVALEVGDPLNENTEVGPLISANEVDRVHAWVLEAKENGARVLCGGNKLSKTTYAPTVLYNPPDSVNVSKKEIFGPVVCIYTYSEIDEAVKKANQLPFHFQSSVFTKNIDRALDMVKKLNATTVLVNDHTAFRVDWMPFGGSKHSGQGVGGIGPSMHEMTLEKLMVIKSNTL